MRNRIWRVGWLVAAALAFVAAPASALQLTLGGDERVNFLGGSLAGTPYATGTAGVDYDKIGGGGAHRPQPHHRRGRLGQRGVADAGGKAPPQGEKRRQE